MLTPLGFVCLGLALACAQGSPVNDTSVEKNNTDVFNVPAKILKSPGEVTGAVLGEACLECEVSGTAPLTITWKKGFPQPNTPQTVIDCTGADADYYCRKNGGELCVRDLTPKKSSSDPGDEGYYQCYASNAYGSDFSNLGRIFINYLKNPDSNTGDQNVQPAIRSMVGKTFSLLCTPSYVSSPQPAYSFAWVDNLKKKLKEVSLNNRVSMTPDGTLHYAFTIDEDYIENGMLTCAQRNPNLGITQDGQYFPIIKEDNPSNEPQPLEELSVTVSPHKPLEGSDFEVWCIFAGKPVPTVSWKFPSGVTVDKRKPFQNPNTLLLKNADASHNGDYECTVELNGEVKVQTIRVEVQFKPDFLIRPSDLNATVGDKSAKFECKAYDRAPALTVKKWYVNGAEAVNSANLLVGSDTLEVLEVVKADVMAVQCVIQNTIGFNVASVSLGVLSPFTWKGEEPKGVFSIEEGQELVELSCETVSDDSELVVTTWYYNVPVDENPCGNTAYPLKNHPGYSFKNNGAILSINLNKIPEGQKVKDSYGGTYSCCAEAVYNPQKLWALQKVEFKAGSGEAVGPIPAATSLWWIALIVGAIVIIVLIILIVCMIQRNRTVAYRVGEKEVKAGHDPQRDLADSGFQDFTRPSEEPVKASRGSLNDPEVGPESDDDSMKEYGDIDTGKFNEDGSFIGQYGESKKQRPTDSVV